MTTYRVELGDRPFGGFTKRTFEVAVPKFAGLCVCCSAASERTVPYDASLENAVVRRPFTIPVCEACAPHALESPSARLWPKVLAGSGVAAFVFGLWVHADHPTSALVWAGFAGAAVLLALAVAVTVLRRARTRVAGGHHPRTSVAIEHGVTVVITRNAALANGLVERHRDARLVGGDVPRARARRR